MKHVVRVNERSRDRSEGVDRKCRSLASGCSSLRIMKCSELALTGAQKAVIYVVRVNEVACDRAIVVDASVPWKAPVPLPGASIVVIVPSGSRRKP
jgi:hypothetical protein